MMTASSPRMCVFPYAHAKYLHTDNYFHIYVDTDTHANIHCLEVRNRGSSRVPFSYRELGDHSD